MPGSMIRMREHNYYFLPAIIISMLNHACKYAVCINSKFNVHAYGSFEKGASEKCAERNNKKPAKLQ